VYWKVDGDFKLSRILQDSQTEYKHLNSGAFIYTFRTTRLVLEIQIVELDNNWSTYIRRNFVGV
jgi:hypothetical protein